MGKEPRTIGDVLIDRDIIYVRNVQFRSYCAINTSTKICIIFFCLRDNCVE